MTNPIYAVFKKLLGGVEFHDERYEGALSHRNLRLVQDGYDTSQITEYLLYSDALVGDMLVEEHPTYAVVNTFGNQFGVSDAPTMLLRAKHAVGLGEPPDDDSKESKSELYHGGYLEQEIAALISLTMGIKLKAGSASRHYASKTDRFGTPLTIRVRNEPKIPPPLTIFPEQTQLPHARGIHKLASIQNLFNEYEALDAPTSIALVRVARTYQEAVWIADMDPAISWLLFVTAIETAAAHWDKSEIPPMEKLKDSKPELAKRLLDEGGDDLARAVAESFSSGMGVTQKFVKFLTNFCPPAPAERPVDIEQVRWSKTSLREAFSKIYDHRSKALHDGRPFPHPMCQAPSSEQGVAAERPFGLYRGDMNSSRWHESDLPMYLHTFEYIVRNALNKWWRENLPSTKD